MVSIGSVFWEKVVSIVVSILSFFLQITVVITDNDYTSITLGEMYTRVEDAIIKSTSYVFHSATWEISEDL